MAKKKKGDGKKKGSKQLLLVGIGLLLLGGYYLYKQTTKVLISSGYFRIHKLQGTSLDVRVFLNVINEGNARLDVQTFIGQLYYKETSLGVVTLVAPGQVPPLGQTELEFKSLISLTSVGMEIFNIVKQGQTGSLNTQDFTIRGTLRAEGFNIPINEKLITA